MNELTLGDRVCDHAQVRFGRLTEIEGRWARVEWEDGRASRLKLTKLLAAPDADMIAAECARIKSANVQRMSASN